MKCDNEALQLPSSVTITMIEKFKVRNILNINNVVCYMLGLTGII